MLKKTLSLIIGVCFFLNTFGPLPYVHADSFLALPAPGTMVSVSPSFDPALIKGLIVHQDNPFLFDFIVDPGQSKLSQQVLKEESDRMIKYFFAALTVPDKDVWVNLSPYEKNRMVPTSLGQTAMGRDLLAQDYLLKQLTASLINPQKELGKIFWNTVYAKAQNMYGTTQVPVNTFNKVWIVPQRAGIYEHGQTAYIVDSHLKVMLEQDYLSMTKHNAIQNLSFPNALIGSSYRTLADARNPNTANQLGSQIIRQIILPEIEKEVNEGKNFATLRQIFYSQVLAVWFKHNLRQALLNQVYANKGTVKGIDQNTASTNEAIYQQYLRAYKKGVFNYIKEDVDPVTQETLPRKYFSGGYDGEKIAEDIVYFSAVDKGMLSAGATNAIDVTTVVETDNREAAALNQNIGTSLEIGGIGLGNTTISTSSSEMAAFFHELGLSVSAGNQHTIIIGDLSIDLSQPQALNEAFNREVRAVGALDPKDMTPEDKAMLGDLSTLFNVILGVHCAGIAILSAAILKSNHEFNRGKEATTIEEKREYYRRFRKDWMHIAGAATIVITGVILGAIHGVNIDSIKLDLLAVLTGSKIGGGIFGFEKMADELVTASNAADNINDSKLKAVENFKGNTPRRFFFENTDWPVMIALFIIAYSQFPASWNPTVLRHVIHFVNKVPHLGWVLPVVPVLMGVGIGAILAKRVDKNRPTKDAAMKTVVSSYTVSDSYTKQRIDDNLPKINFRPRYRRFLETILRSTLTGQQIASKLKSRDYKGLPDDLVSAVKEAAYPRVFIYAIRNLVNIVQSEKDPKVQDLLITYIVRDYPFIRMSDSEGDLVTTRRPFDADQVWANADDLKEAKELLITLDKLGVKPVFLKPILDEADKYWFNSPQHEEFYSKLRNGDFPGIEEPLRVALISNTKVQDAIEDLVSLLFRRLSIRSGNLAEFEGLALLRYIENAEVTDAAMIVKAPQNFKPIALKVSVKGRRELGPDLSEIPLDLNDTKTQDHFKELLKLAHIEGYSVKKATLLLASDGKNLLGMGIALFNDSVFPDRIISFNSSYNLFIQHYAMLMLLHAWNSPRIGNYVNIKEITNLTGISAGIDPQQEIVFIEPAKDAAMAASGKVSVVNQHKVVDKAALPQDFTRGGIDLSEQGAALRVTKDGNGGVKVNVDPALIARVEREGLSQVIPVIINMAPADMRSIFKT